MLKKLFIALFTIATMSVVSSCNECVGAFGKEKVVCDNGGTCNDGECDCLKGYYGDACEQIDLCELNDVVCVYGACEAGDCFCNDGFEGEDCSIESRSKFIGFYEIDEYCPGLDTIMNNQMEIERDLLDEEAMNLIGVFNYNNFPINGFFSKVLARPKKGTNDFDIPNQQPDDNGKTIQGKGTLEIVDETIRTMSIEYTITNGSESISCTLEANWIAPQ